MAQGKKKKLQSKKRTANKDESKAPLTQSEQKSSSLTQKFNGSQSITSHEQSTQRKSSKEEGPQTASKRGSTGTQKDFNKKNLDESVNADASHDDLNLSDDLKSIYYVDDDGTRIDMSKIDQKQSRGKIIAISIAIIVLLGAAAFLGYKIFNQDFGSSTGEIELSITAEDKVASGDVVTIEVEYSNKKLVDIVSGDIELFYPDGFYFHSATPEASNENGRIWNIENVKPGAGGKIRITGQLVGEEDEVKEISTLFTYRPSNFSHDFQETASAQIEVTSSIVELAVDVPSQVQSEQELKYTVEYTNTSQLPLNDIQIVMEYPKGFTFKEASLEPHSDNSVWRIDSLDANETQKLEIIGTLSGDSGDTKQFDFTLGLIELDNTFNAQIEKSSLVLIVNPEVDIVIDAPTVVDIGAEVPMTVTITNTSEAELKDVDLRLSFTGALFTEDEHTFKKINKLSPHQSEEFTYKTQLKTEISGQNQTLEIAANVVSAIVEGSEVSFPNQETLEIKIRGSFDISVEGRYYDDDLTKIGSGPLPPKVVEETEYVIWWSLSTGLNPMQNIKMTTTLPGHVTWKDEFSEELLYDEATRQVTYEKDTVGPNTDVNLEFRLSITPDADDVNKLVVLTGETVISALDKFTKEEFGLQKKRVTSELANDEGASGKGTVVE